MGAGRRDNNKGSYLAERCVSVVDRALPVIRRSYLPVRGTVLGRRTTATATTAVLCCLTSANSASVDVITHTSTTWAWRPVTPATTTTTAVTAWIIRVTTTLRVDLYRRRCRAHWPGSPSWSAISAKTRDTSDVPGKTRNVRYFTDSCPICRTSATRRHLRLFLVLQASVPSSSSLSDCRSRAALIDVL